MKCDEGDSARTEKMTRVTLRGMGKGHGRNLGRRRAMFEVSVRVSVNCKDHRFMAFEVTNRKKVSVLPAWYRFTTFEVSVKDADFHI